MKKWDKGKTFKHINLDEWIGQYDVTYVDPKIMEGLAGLNQLTTRGKELGMKKWDIYIPKDLKKYSKYIILHEAVEHYLRLKGWNYSDSHRYAERVEEMFFGHEKLFQEYQEKV